MIAAKGRLRSRPFVCGIAVRAGSSRVHKTKVSGTANYQEHHAIPFVVGAGNAETREETLND
ncbi:hypothetical protein ACF1BQ_015835 [Bradyrhizobium sp. RDT10]